MPRQTRLNLAGNCKFGIQSLTSKTIFAIANLPILLQNDMRLYRRIRSYLTKANDHRSKGRRPMVPLPSSWMWKVLPRCAREITSRRFRKQIIAWRKDYGRTAIRFVLIVTVAVFAAANVLASKRHRPPVRIYSPMRVARKQRSTGWLTA